MFDRFAICLGWYWYAVNWHGGQFTKEYRILGRLALIGFEVGGMNFENLETANPEAFEIYENLVRKHQSN